MRKHNVSAKVKAACDAIHRDYQPEPVATTSDYNLPVIAFSASENARKFTDSLERFVEEMTGAVPTSKDEAELSEVVSGAISSIVSSCNTVSRCTSRNEQLLMYLIERL